jgi:hypothetical protein
MSRVAGYVLVGLLTVGALVLLYLLGTSDYLQNLPDER